jgi:threonyl-tRNA synthetase
MASDALLTSLTENPAAWLQSLTWEPVSKEAYSKLSDTDKLLRIRHSSAHLMAAALQTLRPQTSFAIGPATPQGFFYDVKLDAPLGEGDLPELEAAMKSQAGKAHPFEVTSVDKAQAIALFTALKQPHKLEIIERIASPTVTLYRSGAFIDLCAGPHVPHTGLLQSFKLLNVASAHWHGETQPSLTRITGTAWPNPKDLQRYLEFIEASKARDHRNLGPQLDLFFFHPWGASAFWQPKGVALRRTLETFWRETLERYGYIEISNPVLYKKELFETSGHWQHFRQNMFVFSDSKEEDPPAAAACCDHEEETVKNDKPQDGNEMVLKPMNCPDTMLFFKHRIRSYKELPLRVAEGQLLHRNEATGAMHGLMRTRMFTQDDAHIFVMPSQVESEVAHLFAMLDEVYKLFKLDYTYSLSTRPENFMGDIAVWDEAEKALKQALENTGKPFLIEEGEGAFYGPKIDVQIRDSLGRQWQCGTFQLDFQLPQRFELKYIAQDGSQQQPIVIHRAVFGSFERFMGILIEHLGGAFPTWLAPIQARVLPISEKFTDYAKQVEQNLKQAGFRVDLELDDSVNYRIRLAETQKVPYMLVVGEREAEAGTVAVRRYHSKEKRVLPLAELVEELQAKRQSKELDVELQQFADLFWKPVAELSTEAEAY